MFDGVARTIHKRGFDRCLMAWRGLSVSPYLAHEGGPEELPECSAPQNSLPRHTPRFGPWILS